MFFIGFLLVLAQVALFSQETKIEKDRAKLCSSSCFKALLPGTGSVYGTMTDSSDVHYSGRVDSIMGSKAKIYKRYKIVRMLEAEYEKNGNKFSIQLLEFKGKKAALMVWLKEKPQFGGKLYKEFPSVYMHAGKKVYARFYGTLYLKVTTASKNSPTAWKGVKSLFMVASKKINDFSKTSGKAPYVKSSLAKIDGMYKRIAKLTNGLMKKYTPVLIDKKEFPKVFGFIPITKGITEMGKVTTKSGKKRSVKTTIFMISKKVFMKGKPTMSSQNKVKDFVKKYSNRFRYYKIGKWYGIIGKYQGKVIGIYGTRYPAQLKQRLEKFRMNFFKK